MIIREGIEVTKITLDGYELPISEGYSEFLLRAGYWRYDEEIEKIKRDEILAYYDRKVVLEDGKLCTILIYKGNKKKRDKKSWIKKKVLWKEKNVLYTITHQVKSERIGEIFVHFYFILYVKYNS